MPGLAAPASKVICFADHLGTCTRKYGVSAADFGFSPVPAPVAAQCDALYDSHHRFEDLSCAAHSLFRGFVRVLSL
jgi:hypothetical protein